MFDDVGEQRSRGAEEQRGKEDSGYRKLCRLHANEVHSRNTMATISVL
jgi:hypothetical protein